MSGDLLPCPFCGGSDFYRTADNINNTDRINCSACGANAVLWKWNTRTEPTPQPSVGDAELVEAIGEALFLDCRPKLTAQQRVLDKLRALGVVKDSAP